MTQHDNPDDMPPPRWHRPDSTSSPASTGLPDGPGDPTVGRGASEDRATRTPPLGPDASVREIARAAHAAFLGRDLIQSGPSFWLFGRRARTRRDRNRAAADEARQRRGQFQQLFEAPPPPQQPQSPPPPSRQRLRPVNRRTNRIVIASLTGLAATVLAAALWLGAGPDAHPSTAPPPVPATGPAPRTGPSATLSAASSAGTAAVPAQPPVPSGGVAPVSPRPHTPLVSAGSVVLVDPPAGDPTPAELATPEGAVRAWLARLCPFDYHAPLGAAEQRARPAMTDGGWTVLDPTKNAGARASWDRTVAARESGRCAAPTALISPEAPRSPSAAIVIGAVTRVVTPDGDQPYVEQLSEVRIVRRGADGLWRVDLPTEGG